MNKKLCSVLKDKHGFSLTEVMVGGAILAGVALAGAQLAKNQFDAQKKIELDKDLLTYHSSLSRLMANSSHCNATFRNHLTTPQAVAAGTMTELRICTANCGHTSGMTGTALDLNAFTTGFFTGARYVGTGDYIDRSRRWRVDTIRIPEARSVSGPIRIRITYSGPSGRKVDKELRVHARFGTANTFAECFDEGENFLKTTQQELCETMKYVSTTGQIATFNTDLQECDFQLSKQCGAGFQSFLEADGVYRCRKIFRPGDPTRMDGTSSPTCTPPLKPRVFFNSVNKTMDIRCE